MYLSQHPFNTTGIQLVPKVRRDGFLSASILHRIKCRAKSARISSLRRVSNISINVDYVKEKLKKEVKCPGPHSQRIPQTDFP